MTKLEQVARAIEPVLWADLDAYVKTYGTQGGWERPIRESLADARAAITALKVDADFADFADYEHRQIINAYLDRVLEGKL